MMGCRPRSPTAYPEDPWEPQDGGPGPAKRPKSESEAAPSLDNLAWSPTAGTLIFVAVLPAGCALHVLLDDVELLLEPEPTSVRQVCLGGRILMLVPEALLDSDVEAPRVQILEPAAVLSLPGEYMALEPEFCPAVQEIAFQEEANEDDADLHTNFPRPWMDAAGSPVSVLRDPELQGSFLGPRRQETNLSPEKGSSHHDDYLDLHLQEAFHESPLQPLPPSPSPGPVEHPKRPQGPPCNARRSLILQ